MRELPEPDGDHDRVFDRGTVVYKKESVLAIQKQAYEDGLRDAPEGYVLAPKEPTTSMIDAGFYEPTHPATSAVKVARVYEAMLTASQKEQQ